MHHLFLLLILFLSTSTSSSQCLPSHRDSLLDLKSGFDTYPSGSGLSSWTPRQDCCAWDGVTCDGSTGEVIALDLSGWGISGNVSASLFELTSLRTLNLAFNYFNSSIPSGMERLGKLTHLNLSNSGFWGQIPGGISRLVDLVLLDLSYAYTPLVPLELKNPVLGDLVKSLGKLRYLYLDNVNLSASGVAWSSDLLVPQIRVLSLSSCSLSGHIDASLFTLKYLTELRLDNNGFGTELPRLFGNLTVFQCSLCNLSGSLPRAIFGLRGLTRLDLSMNPFLRGSLPESVGNLVALESLRLSNCDFDGTVPATVENLVKLVEVDVSFNNFSGGLPKFRACDGLRKIVFANNMFEGRIPSSFGRLPNLMVLDLQSNLLTGPIPSSLFGLPSLQSLELNHNLLSEKLQVVVPHNVSSSLKTVDLSSNMLQGSIPLSIFNLIGLNVLALASNNFTGTVELNLLQNLPNLSSIDLSNNRLTVKVEGDGSFFPSISRVKLAYCNITEFPVFLRNQYRINHLDLSGNRLVGLIPSWIWSVGNGAFSYLNVSYNSLTGYEDPVQPLFNSSLSVIDLHSNMLKGPILCPPRLNSVIDYSNNSFGSSIQSNISEHLKRTIFFSISMNNVTGILPKSICDSMYLQVLDFSYNNLSGEIPSCLARMNALTVLNLRGNSFSGTIPLDYKEDCKLRTINLNANQLKGHLPPSLRYCSQLEVLDLGNNQMSGILPSWLADLPMLRVLVLRSNQFNGTLKSPCSSNESSFNMLQIIDLSYNYFSGNLSWEYFQCLQAMVLPNKNADPEVLKVSYLSLSRLYYQDTVMVTSKGLDMTLVKILTIFTSIDISNNGFEGVIPENLGKLKSLYVLNMSNNFLTGRIPHSFGNITQLGSLDLSKNNLSGEIPKELASLTFLSFLNLSYNNLVGQIPQHTQLLTFTEWSFIGNPDLCGLPLRRQCLDSSFAYPSLFRKTEFSWQFIFVGSGFGGGLGIVIGPLVLWKKGRKWYFRHVDKVLLAVIPSSIWHLADCWLESLDVDDRQTVNFTLTSSEGLQKSFCLFCTELDFTSRQVGVHHTECSCSKDKR